MSEYSDTTPATSADPTPTTSADPSTSTADSPDGTSPDGTSPASAAVWPAGAYAPTITGSGAAKLASSAVAPAVAAARGSYTIAGGDQLADFCKTWHIDRRKSQGRRLWESAETGGFLVMPWYLPIHIARADDQEPARPAAIQYRPSHPAVDDAGRERKYEIVAGHDTIIGGHPATPPGWFDSDRPIILAEGQLKADAVLTGLLAAGGIDTNDLGDTDPDTARTRLRDLMGQLPQHVQYLVLSNVGVWNWKKNPEWATFRLQDRQVLVAVDGDVATNFQVHDATSRLWEFLTRSGAHPSLLSPTDPAGRDGKIGVDDYLAGHGGWPQLVRQTVDTLPPAPAKGDTERVGERRISADSTRLEECRPVKDSDGTVTAASWEPLLDLGGRIVSFAYSREPTDAERRTGRFGAGAPDTADPADDDTVEVEVCWTGADNQLRSATVCGPSAIVGYPPAQWHRNGALLPPDLLEHPSWPPTGRLGEDWLAAVKAHRADERTRRVRWTKQGWVPVENDLPVFVIGQQVIGPPGVSDRVLSAVDDTSLPNSSRFGVGDPDPRDWDDDEYRTRLAEDLGNVLEIFPDGWTHPGYAAAVIGAAIRAALPLRPVSTIWMVGPAGSGKSFTAAAACSFWAEYPGAWNTNTLPGSAKDTFAAHENAVDKSAFTVIDDLAPSSNPRKHDDEAAAIDDIVRAVYNGKGRGRMTKEGNTRPSVRPHAVVLATAENEPEIESIRQRSITLAFGSGSLPDSREATALVRSLCEDDGAPARVTQGMIKYLRHRAGRNADGWEAVCNEVELTYSNARWQAASQLQEAGFSEQTVERSSLIAGDITVGLLYLRDMAAAVDVDPGLADPLETVMPDKLVEVIIDGFRGVGQSSPGRAALQAIAALVDAKRAHLVNGDDPTAPPGVGCNDAGPDMFGWHYTRDEWQPCNGPNLGFVTWRWARSHGPVVMLHPFNAFRAAKQYAPELIPAGSSSLQAWKSAQDDGLLVADLLATDPNDPDQGTLRRAVKEFAGAGQTRTVPVPVATLFGAYTPGQSDDSATGAGGGELSGPHLVS